MELYFVQNKTKMNIYKLIENETNPDRLQVKISPPMLNLIQLASGGADLNIYVSAPIDFRVRVLTHRCNLSGAVEWKVESKVLILYFMSHDLFLGLYVQQRRYSFETGGGQIWNVLRLGNNVLQGPFDYSMYMGGHIITIVLYLNDRYFSGI